MPRGRHPHIATERARAVQQRARKQRRSPVRGLAVTSSILLGLLAGLSIYIIVGTARAEQRARLQAAATPTNASYTRQSTPHGAPLRSLGTITASNVAALAWSPDGTILATASAPQGNDPGGVMLLTQSASGSLSKRLPAFEHLPPPGTLAWSPDGTELAAGGGTRLVIWNVATSRIVTTIALPFEPMTNLYIFSATTGTLVMSAPAEIFLPDGYAQWQPGGQIRSATQPTASTLTLWRGPGGARIFRDPTTGAVEIGMNDADVQAHAAFIRWSPDGRYLVWGYPRLPLAPHAGTPGTLTVPDATLAKLAHAVGASHNPAASIILWPAPDATRYAALDGTRATPRIALYDARSGTLRATISTPMPADAPPNILAWQPGTTLALALTASATTVARYAIGP